MDYGEIKLYDFESGEQKVLYEREAQHASSIKLLAMTEESIYFTVYDPLYGWEYIWQDMPRPYETYREREGYGPGGDLGKPYYERERR